MIKQSAAEKFDKIVDNRVVAAFNWAWKSGLMVLLISLVGANLNYQRQSYEEAVTTRACLQTTQKEMNHIAKLIIENQADVKLVKEDLNGVKVRVTVNETAINFLKRKGPGNGNNNEDNY